MCGADPGGKTSSDHATTFQALLRVHLQRLQVLGVYFEPRSDDGFSPRDQYSVIWPPMLDKAAVEHQLRTLDRAIALARLGRKFGIRTKESDEAELYWQLRLSRCRSMIHGRTAATPGLSSRPLNFVRLLPERLPPLRTPSWGSFAQNFRRMVAQAQAPQVDPATEARFCSLPNQHRAARW